MTAVAASSDQSVDGLNQGFGDMRIDLQSLKASSLSGSGSTKGKGKAVELVGAERYLIEGPPTTTTMASRRSSVASSLDIRQFDRASIIDTIPNRVRSIVTYAMDLSTSLPVVLKTVRDTQTAEHEVMILKLLESENVPHSSRLLDTYDAVDEEFAGSKVLVYGRHRKLECRNTDLLLIRYWAKQLLTVLASIHKLRIAHNTINTSNLFTTNDDTSLVLISWSQARQSTTATTAKPRPPIGPSSVEPDFAAPDMFAAGTVLGQWLEPYLPDCSLNYLGSRLVRKSTTTYISRALIAKLDSQRMGREAAWHPMVAHAADLLSKILEPDEVERIGADTALRHPFIMAEDEEFKGSEYEEVKKAQTMAGLRGRAAGVSERRPRVMMRYR
ncbi:hypothetical protein HK097_011177 [Rhizophlyctis rosea]|uniref:Protein kinase domain-containing protein n=1 Tax=Rhizophlyctis rosea TaxID=64517 RepID=A0AAD5SRQ1_9FUNG|nr:hypothetical protein HK097_011177 [Rhizophlyctis rosea]